MKRCWIWIFFYVTGAQAQLLWEEHFEVPGKFSESQYAHYKDGVYHLHGKNGRLSYCSKIFSNAAILIRSEYIGGPTDAEYGLIFRAQNLDSFYIFTITGDGHYYLWKRHNKKYHQLIPKTSSSFIRQQGVNYLMVYCEKQEIGVYINGRFITSVSDNTFLEGFVGVATYSGVHVHYDDLMVYRRPKDASLNFNFDPTPIDTTADYPINMNAERVDNFNDPNSGWSESDNVYYERGYYRMWNASSSHLSWNTTNLMDYDLEVNFRIERFNPEHKANSAGVILRSTSNTDYLSILVHRDGQISCGFTKNSINRTLWRKTINELKVQELIRMKVRLKGDQLELWINGQYIDNIPVQEEIQGTNFGFWTAAGVELRVYSLYIKEIERSFAEWLQEFTTSASFITWALIFVSMFLTILAIKYNRRKQLLKSALKNILELIRQKRGSVRLQDVQRTYHLKEKQAREIMTQACRLYNGQQIFSPDGNDVYDFPDYFRSE